MIRHTTSFSIALIVHLVLIAFFMMFLMHTPVQIQEKNTFRIEINQILTQHQKEQKTKKSSEKVKPAEKKFDKPKEKVVAKNIVQAENKKVFVETEAQKALATTELIQKDVEVSPVVAEVNASHEKVETIAVQEMPAFKEESKPDVTEANYKEEHLQEIARLLREHLYYPRNARKRGLQGVVTVRFKLSKDAYVSEIEVLEGSYDILSKAAVQTIQNLTFKFPKPQEELLLHIPIQYKLQD